MGLWYYLRDKAKQAKETFGKFVLEAELRFKINTAAFIALKPTAQPNFPPLVWDERHNVISTLLEAPGTATTAKVMLIGCPELFELFTDLAYITLTHPAWTPCRAVSPGQRMAIWRPIRC